MLKRIKNYGKFVIPFITLIAVILSFNFNVLAVKPTIKQNSYYTVTEICDWGAAVTKVIVSLGKPVKQGSVCKDTFKVFVSK